MTPDISLMRLRSISAWALFFAVSRPITCRSIGAGRPKFRICETMSAGRNEKVVEGKRRGSCSRIRSTSSAVSP